MDPRSLRPFDSRFQHALPILRRLYRDNKILISPSPEGAVRQYVSEAEGPGMANALASVQRSCVLEAGLEEQTGRDATRETPLEYRIVLGRTQAPCRLAADSSWH